MARLALVACAAGILSGCHDGYVITDRPPGGSYRIPVGMPPPVRVTERPPMPPLHEATVFCSSGQTYVPGHFAWRGEWFWVFGGCVTPEPGAVFVPPFHGSGYYVPAYWAKQNLAPLRPLRPLPEP